MTETTPANARWLDRARAVTRAARVALGTRHATAQVLSIADSRALVRCVFLSSAVRTGWLSKLTAPGGVSLSDLVRGAGIARPDRLEAWLALGCELGELRCASGRYRIHGRRSRAIASGDRPLSAHYRSMLDYQTSPYRELDELLAGAAGSGRQDLSRYADEIAEVSLAAAPFVVPLLRQVLATRRPRAVLDAGCGSAFYSEVVLDSSSDVTVTGVDLSEEVISRARANLSAAGYAERCTLHAADIESWASRTTGRFDLVMLHNNIYYFDREYRPTLLRIMRGLLAPAGEILLTTMTTPGSVASAHLHFMLLAQAGPSALPTPATLLADFDSAALEVTRTARPVPTEPYLVVRAVPAKR